MMLSLSVQMCHFPMLPNPCLKSYFFFVCLTARNEYYHARIKIPYIHRNEKFQKYLANCLWLCTILQSVLYMYVLHLIKHGVQYVSSRDRFILIDHFCLPLNLWTAGDDSVMVLCTCNILEVPINSFVVVVTNLLGETSSDWPWVITTPSSLGLLKLSTSWNVGIFQLLYDSFCCKGNKNIDISQWAHKNKRKSVR